MNGITYIKINFSWLPFDLWSNQIVSEASNVWKISNTEDSRNYLQKLASEGRGKFQLRDGEKVLFETM